MGLEGADGTLRGIATMDVGRYQLESGTPFLGDLSLLFSTGLIVEDLQVHTMV